MNFLIFFQIFFGRNAKIQTPHAFTRLNPSTILYISTTDFICFHLLDVSDSGIWRYFHKASDRYIYNQLL